MPDYPIDLGRKMEDGLISIEKTSKSETHYPSIYLEWDSDYDLPKSGTMVVTFDKDSETNTKDKDGNTRQMVTLSIKEIKSVVGESDDEGDQECTDCALDRLKQEADKQPSKGKGY